MAFGTRQPDGSVLCEHAGVRFWRVKFDGVDVQQSGTTSLLTIGETAVPLDIQCIPRQKFESGDLVFIPPSVFARILAVTEQETFA
ncbi:MAG: hypothetical protein QG621_230 [Patescibacteria group bacterium]|jgi:hypothetical protein|nr:hypothetical protein [Patescibacteria group bacterium]